MLGSLVGQYRIVEQVGRGSAGTVYKAVDESLGREVAIKILNPELAGTQSIRRFRTEATALARLNHPAVTTIYELFRSNAELLMVMEFVRGETLEHLSQRLGPVPLDRAAYVIDQVLGGIGHAHGAGIVHRDIKPANVMLTVAGAIKIMDFGVARVRGAEHAVEGYMMGTPAYMAPEQVLGGDVDARADLYSVGIIFYRLLTGTLPFTGKTPLEVLQKQMTEVPVRLDQHRHDLPDWCDTILQRALAKSPDHRFQTAEEFRAVLAEMAGIATKSELASDLIRTEEETLEVVASGALQPTEPWTGGGALRSLDDRACAQAAAPVQVSSSSPASETLVLKPQPLLAIGPIVATATIIIMVAYIALGRPAAVPVTAPQQRDEAPSVAADAVARRSGQVISQPPAPQSSAQPSSTRSAGQPPAQQSVRPSTTQLSARPPARPAGEPPNAGQQTVETAGSQRPAPPSRQASVRPPAHAAATANAAQPPLPTSSKSGKRANETATPVTFETKALVSSGHGHKEYDAQLVLTDREVRVVSRDGDSAARVVQAVPYGSVISITYSRGRDPLWLSQEGPEIVARTGGRTFGLFRRDRHWVTLQTRTTPRFVVVRISDSTAKEVLAALEVRTGRRIQDLSAQTAQKSSNQ